MAARSLLMVTVAVDALCIALAVQPGSCPSDSPDLCEVPEDQILLQRASGLSSVKKAAEESHISINAEAETEDQGSVKEVVSESEGTQGTTTLTAFFWNTHWQCSLGARGAHHTCKDKAKRRFAELALQEGASIAASVELSHGMSQPVHLNTPGYLDGWAQVDGPCTKGHNGDASALMIGPGWQVIKSGGGCLRHDYDTRAFAVASVKPPFNVQDCPELCLIAIHAPHSDITRGNSVVRDVCGAAVKQCVIAMGDWNAPADHLHGLWTALVGGQTPHAAGPNERTCCFPESTHYGIFDHLATNIHGATLVRYNTMHYQLTEENPVQEHRPLSVTVQLPVY